MEKQNYNFIESEKNIQDFWHKNKIYELNKLQKNIDKSFYSIDTPPPTVSGSLHIGHVFSYTQTDIIARYKRMSGYNVFYPIGFDDNGLATERFVEKKLNIRAKDLTRSEFINLCLNQTTIIEKDFELLFKKLGLSIDWNLVYSTIDNNSRKISQNSFIELYKKGHIYRKSEPALYCTVCHTTVAQAELDNIEKKTHFNDIIFKTDHQDLIIATTRPELLVCASIILYHPEDKRYQNLFGKKAIVPIYNHQIEILPDIDVNPEKGTGLVMVSTFGDKQDIIWAKRYNLPYIKAIDFDGILTEITGPLKGLKVNQARKKILELLKENNLLINQKEIYHHVNVHERCKNEIEYLVLTQWFLKIIPFKDKLLELAENINWYPEFMKSRYINWVENISWDWCLSRQRFYGIPFPVWHCANCNEILLADQKDLPIDPQEISYKEKYNKNCPKCANSEIIPDRDVMDTWNTSSLTPYIAKNLYYKNNINLENIFDNNNFIPMTMRPQAHDIIRTWAFYTIVKSYMHNNSIPWKNIIISGHVLSSEKEKISKSKENSPLAPEVLLEKYSADAIRYWTASASLGYDVAFSDNQIKIGNRLIIKLFNAFKFINQHIKNINIKNIKNNLRDINIEIINEWIIDKLNKCIIEYNKNFENYEFKLSLDAIEKFFWSDFCDNYLEIIKDILFNPQNYNQDYYQATIFTLYNIGINILQLYAPYLPYITEYLYCLIYKEKINISSIHQTKFSDFKIDLYFENGPKLMEHIISIIKQVRKLKTENNLSLKTELEKLIITTDKNLYKLFNQNNTLIKAITNTKNIEYNFSMQNEENNNYLEKLENNLFIAKIKEL